MPGWILVANRSSFTTTLRDKGRMLTAATLLTCIVVLAGCSNLRQQSLEMPLPVLPSQAAVEADKVSAPELPLSPPTAIVADSSPKNASALDPSVFVNDFDDGFEQSASVQSFLPTNNDFQPPQSQPQARFVGVSNQAEMTEVKLKAVSNKSAPAPTIGTAPDKVDTETCNTPEACNNNAMAQCDCCKNKQLPKFAVVEPVDPAELPGLFGANRKPAKDATDISIRSPLQALRSTGVKPEIKMVATANTNSPIRLTAMQDSETLNVRLPSATTTSPAQTQNKAQLLIPIAPEALKEFKAESKRATAQAAKTLQANPYIKVSPIMDVNAGLAEASPAVVTMATANETIESHANSNEPRAEFIPISSSGIRVSAIPFKSQPKPVIKTAEPTVSKTIVEPTLMVKPIEVAEFSRTFEPNVSDANAFIAASKSTAKRFAPALTKPARTLPVAPTVVAATHIAFNEFPAWVKKHEPLRAKPAPPAINIDPLDDLNDLPDMSQIEHDLAEFKKQNTFDPSTVIKADTIDPALLLAKLDGPPKKVAAPVIKYVETAPDKDLITQQLKAQSSALLDLQNAIKQLKPEPVTVVHEEPELTLSNAAFCTKISGFGQFKPFAANTFSGSQKTLLYCEVENQTSKQFTSLDGSQQFETILHGSIVIYDANDQVVQTGKFPAIKDIARQQRRDFYVYFPVQFNELASGDYRLELSVEDVTGSKTAALQPFMRFSVR